MLLVLTCFSLLPTKLAKKHEFCAWRMHCLLSERSIVWKKVCCFKALKTCVYENYFVSLVWE